MTDPRATSIVWFQATDLRVADNLALRAAAERGVVVPTFVWAPREEEPWSPGAATRWWLHGSLSSLQQALRALGSELVFLRADHGTHVSLLQLAEQVGASAVFWNRRYEPFARAREQRVRAELAARSIHAESFNASLLVEPSAMVRSAGSPGSRPRRTAGQSGGASDVHGPPPRPEPWRVFTPFWGALQRSLQLAGGPTQPQRSPRALEPPRSAPIGVPLEALRLLPRPDWAAGLRATWQPGEPGAHAALERFVRDALADYGTGRDRPGRIGTSRLSPHLHAGEISPRQVFEAVQVSVAPASPARGSQRSSAASDTFLRELGWREFAYHLLWHFPDLAEAPMDQAYVRFPWRTDREDARAWRTGQTGYPFVDAGLRELWQTGWMHNRVRMVVASFFTKDLLLPWLEGARWFWDTLVDADLANNTLGWQWTAGCGPDPAPFFRVFNPVLQGRRFDPDGGYVRRYVPELAALSDQFLHAPWTAPPLELAAAGVRLGSTYPWPIVDHPQARQRALSAYATITR